MIGQKVDGICILANYSEQFLLTDEERDTLLALSVDHVAGRVPVIVTCSHYSTRIAVARARKAHEAGAKMLMLNRETVSAVANSNQMAETEVMRINANAPSTVMTNQPGSLIAIWVFAQPR